MSRARAEITCPRDPIGLSAEQAAAYLGVSPTLFRRAVDSGHMPKPRRLFNRLIWDAEEVRDAMRRLPHRGETDQSPAGDAFNWGSAA